MHSPKAFYIVEYFPMTITKAILYTLFPIQLSRCLARIPRATANQRLFGW